jgi:hypothetical protein
VQKIFSPEWNHLSAVKATTVVAETRERHTKNDQPAAMTTRSIKQQRVRASGPPALQHRPSRRSADRSWRANGSRFHLRRPPWPEGWCQHPHDRAKVDQDDRDGSRTSRAAGGGRAVMSEGETTYASPRRRAPALSHPTARWRFGGPRPTVRRCRSRRVTPRASCLRRHF